LKWGITWASGALSLELLINTALLFVRVSGKGMSPQVLEDYINRRHAMEAEKGDFASSEETKVFVNTSRKAR
jgi:hypothetical protein